MRSKKNAIITSIVIMLIVLVLLIFSMMHAKDNNDTIVKDNIISSEIDNANDYITENAARNDKEDSMDEATTLQETTASNGILSTNPEDEIPAPLESRSPNKTIGFTINPKKLKKVKELDNLARDSVFYVIAKCETFEEYSNRYINILTGDAYGAMYSKFNLYEVSFEDYKTSVSPESIYDVQEDGTYPIYNENYDIEGYGTFDDYAKALYKIDSKYIYKINNKSIEGDKVIYDISFDKGVDRKVILTLNEDYKVTAIDDEKIN